MAQTSGIQVPNVIYVLGYYYFSVKTLKNTKHCLSICLFSVQDGKMSHTDRDVLPDSYHPIKDAYSHCEVNLLVLYSIYSIYIRHM